MGSSSVHEIQQNELAQCQLRIEYTTRCQQTTSVNKGRREGEGRGKVAKHLHESLTYPDKDNTAKVNPRRRGDQHIQS